MAYHVRITRKSNKTSDLIELDLTEENLNTYIVNPYLNGDDFHVDGTQVSPNDVDKLKINETAETSDKLLPSIEAERRASSVITMISDAWYVTEKGKNVTRKFITATPKVSKSNPSGTQRGNITQKMTDSQGVQTGHMKAGRDIHINVTEDTSAQLPSELPTDNTFVKWLIALGRYLLNKGTPTFVAVTGIPSLMGLLLFVDIVSFKIINNVWVSTGGLIILSIGIVIIKLYFDRKCPKCHKLFAGDEVKRKRVGTRKKGNKTIDYTKSTFKCYYCGNTFKGGVAEEIVQEEEQNTFI